MFRRLLRQQIEAVQAGRDPLGVAFDTACATVQVEATGELYHKIIGTIDTPGSGPC